ncbi:MAG: glycosyltransferase family 2 protein [Candidatus Hodarchaeota archaeon]
MENINTELSIIVPMYNEEANVRNTVDQIRSAMKAFDSKWELIIVNDGSTDNSLQMAQEIEREENNIRVISYYPNSGRGKALRTGFENGRGNFIITIDFDLSYDASHILKLYKEIKNDNSVDIVLGSAYMAGGQTDSVPWFRLFTSKIGNKILSYAFPFRITTSTCILRGYKRKVLDSLPLESNGKEIHLEILSKAISLGYAIKEIPATLKARKKGKSKFKFRSTTISHLLFSFFEKPILVFGFIGLLLLISGFVGGIYITVLELQDRLNPVRPLVTLVVILVLSGLQILSFGFIAIQIGIIRKEIYKVQKENRLLFKNSDSLGKDL